MCGRTSLLFLLRPVAVMRQLLDVVHQAVELPLRIDFRSPAQREAIESLVMADVGEDRLDRGEAPAIERAALRAVDGPAHDVGVARRRGGGLAAEETDLPGAGLVRRAQTVVS